MRFMRTWEIWAQAEPPPRGPIDLEHYEACGGVDSALSRHADEAYFALGDDRAREIAELMFKRITELGDDHREVRRPTAVAEIAAVARATPGRGRGLHQALRRNRDARSSPCRPTAWSTSPTRA